MVLGADCSAVPDVGVHKYCIRFFFAGCSVNSQYLDHYLMDACEYTHSHV
jgi:hypothetical protein